MPGKKERKKRGRENCVSGARKDVVTDANVGSKEKSTVETHNSSSHYHTFYSPTDFLSYHSHNVTYLSNPETHLSLYFELLESNFH